MGRAIRRGKEGEHYMAPRSTKGRKPTPKSGSRKRPASISVGDEIRVPVEVVKQLRASESQRSMADRGGEGIEGLVCSIRDIASGKLVTKTHGALEGFILEVLHDRTFHPQFSSARNTGGPKGPIEVHRNPTWLRMRDALQKMATSEELTALTSGGAAAEPFASLLDGWRVVKLRASVAEVL
jgi:hypothetical protein